jgi:transposase
MAKKLDERIAEIEKKLEELKRVQNARAERQKAISQKRERKADTRRKILIGAIILAKIEQKVMDEKLLYSWIDQSLSREDDRALFGLGPQ